MPAQTYPGRAIQIGFNRQTLGYGNPVAPSSVTGAWIKWRDGSMVTPKKEITHEFEGDGSRGEALAYTKLMHGQAHLVHAPRPSELGQLIAAFSGAKSDVVTGTTSPYTHTITPNLAAAANDFFTIVQQLIIGGTAAIPTGSLFRVEDAICTSLTLTCSASDPVLRAETDWYGGNTRLDTTLIGNIGGSSGTGFEASGPLYWWSTASNWNFPGPMGGDIAAAVKDMSLKFEYQFTPSDYQTESIIPLAFLPGNMTVTGDITVLWQDGGAAAWTYFGQNGASASYPAQSTDPSASAVPTGGVSLKFSTNANSTSTVNSAMLTFPNCSFETAEFTPDLAGKPIEQKITIHPLRYSASGAPDNLYQAVVIANGAGGGYSS